MAKFLTSLDLSKNELRNAVIQVLASDPSTPNEGQIYYNSATKKLRQWNGTAWVEYGTGAGSGDVISNTAVSVDGEVALFNSTTGKSIKRATGSGLAKLTSGVLGIATSGTDFAPATSGAGILKGNGAGGFSTATAGTDYSTAGATETFTNKTFDANGTGNAISNIETADLAAGVLNISTSLAGATNTQVPSALATKTYVDTAVTGLLDFKGALDASTNPNYPAASKGDTYVITVAGKVGGASGTSVDIGDMVLATADNAGGTEASVGTSWSKLEHNLVGALLSSNNLSDLANAATAFGNIKQAATTGATGVVALATQAEAQAKTDTAKALTAASVADFARKYTALIGNASLTDIPVTHGLGSQYVTAQVFDAATNARVECDVVLTSSTVTTFTFAVAPASNAYRVVITG